MMWHISGKMENTAADRKAGWGREGAVNSRKR